MGVESFNGGWEKLTKHLRHLHTHIWGGDLQIQHCSRRCSFCGNYCDVLVAVIISLFSSKLLHVLLFTDNDHLFDP